MSDEFFSFKQASEKAGFSRKNDEEKPVSKDSAAPDEIPFANEHDMEKSIMLYAHLRRGIKGDDRTRDGLKSVLRNVKVKFNDRLLEEKEIDYFIDTLNDDKLWDMFGDFYWALCGIHYKIMTELKILHDLKHVHFKDDGTIDHVENVYGRPRAADEILQGTILGTLTISYFYKHFKDYKATLQKVADNCGLTDEAYEHLGEWGHILIAHLTIMMVGGGVLDYSKFRDLCKKRKLTPNSTPTDIWTAAKEEFDIKD